MQTCACGYQNRDPAQFCVNCGKPLTAGLGTGRLPPNTILQGRYIIVRKVGQGGMGAVYQAADQRIAGRLWAIKEMSMSQLPTAADRTQAAQAFQQEAAMLARLDHASLPKVADFFQEGGWYYLVMDFIEGATLEDVMAARGRVPFPETQVLDWARQLCEVLEHLHNQNPPVIFRDLKPGNIMVTPDGRAKLVDFGIARHFKPGQAQDTQRFGTKGYAPAEQFGKGQTDTRTDIYSLGVTLHELLTGHDPTTTPFNLPPARQLNPAVPPHIETAIQKAIENRPDDRFQTATEMRQALIPRMLSVSPPALDFGTLKPGQSAAQPLHIANAGTGLLAGMLHSSETWLRISPTNFSGNTAAVQVQVDTRGLRAGQRYHGSLEITSNAGLRTVPVSVTTAGAVLPAPLGLIGAGIALLILCSLIGFAAIRSVFKPAPTATPIVMAGALIPTGTPTPGGPPGPVETPTPSLTVSPSRSPTATRGATNTPTATRRPTHTPTATKRPTGTPTLTPLPRTNPNFRADRTTIARGECTTLRWDVEGIRAVYLDGWGQVGHGSTRVCPPQTQTFTLTVVERDGREIPHRLTITVSGTTTVSTFVIEHKGCIGGLSKGIGQVKGQILDRNGNIIVGAVVEVTVDGIAGVVPAARSNEAGWYEWNLTPGQKIRFVSLKVGGQPVNFSPADFTVSSQSGCYQHVNFRQQ